MMRKLKFFLAPFLMLSCTSNYKSQDSKIQSIDSIINAYSKTIHRVITDTIYSKNDTIIKNYQFDEQRKLLLIYEEETGKNDKFLIYVANDSLIKIVIKNSNPNSSDDQAAAYYVEKDSVIKKNETRFKMDDIKTFIKNQKENIVLFNDKLSRHL